MDGIIRIDYGNGYYLFKLNHVLKNINKTKHSLSKYTMSEYSVIHRLSLGKLSRIDLDVMARVCDYCNCKLSDIIEYIPNAK